MLKKLAKTPVGIFHGVVDGVLLGIVKLNVPIRKFVGRVVGDAEYQAEKRFFMGLAEAFVGANTPMRSQYSSSDRVVPPSLAAVHY